MKWTPDDHGCIYDEAGCFARLTPNKAERLATRHNADIDALTAERDELKRRLGAVVAMLEPGPEPDRQLTNIPNHTDSDLIWSEWNRQASLHARAVAIAEGREG